MLQKLRWQDIPGLVRLLEQGPMRCLYASKRPPRKNPSSSREYRVSNARG
jgi:hypothetical protein